MTVTEPDVIETGRYSSKEACEKLGISKPTLWAHTNSGKIRFGIRKSNGRKFYTGADIKKYWKAQL